MGTDYGRITTINRTNAETGVIEKMHKCNLCIFERDSKYKIKPHLSSVHNQLEKHEDLNCPYCKELSKTLQTLNRHIYI